MPLFNDPYEYLKSLGVTDQYAPNVLAPVYGGRDEGNPFENGVAAPGYTGDYYVDPKTNTGYSYDPGFWGRADQEGNVERGGQYDLSGIQHGTVLPKAVLDNVFKEQQNYWKGLVGRPNYADVPGADIYNAKSWSDPGVQDWFGFDPSGKYVGTTKGSYNTANPSFKDDLKGSLPVLLAAAGMGAFNSFGLPGLMGGSGSPATGTGAGAGAASGAAGGAPVSQIPLFGQTPLAGVPVSANAAWIAPGALSSLSQGASLANTASGLFGDGTSDMEPGALEAASSGAGGSGLSGLFSGLFGDSGAGGALGGAGGLLSLLAKGLDIGTGIYGIKQAGDLRDQATAAGERADPFGPYRAGYAEQLRRLSENPSTITQTPGWDAGIQAVQRSAAGRGYLNSGNEISALQNFGGNFFNNESARLSRLAGADINPGAGAQLSMQGNQSAANLLAQALSRISAGIGSF